MFIFDVFYPEQRWLNINSYCMESHSFFVVFVYGVECSLFICGSFVYSLTRYEGLRRPAYSAGPKQVTDLHHIFGCFGYALTRYEGLRRPACSAGPKQVTDLHHACGYFVYSLTRYESLRRPAYSAGPKQVTDLHHIFGFCSIGRN